MIICPGCKFGYELSGLAPGRDFECKHCQKVFPMPPEIPEDLGREKRQRISCPRCQTPYDVSGYLAGTMFSCQNCDHVLSIAGPGEKTGEPVPEPPAGRLSRDPSKSTRRLEAAEDPSALPEPDFSYSRFAQAAARRESEPEEGIWVSAARPKPRAEKTPPPAVDGEEPPGDAHEEKPADTPSTEEAAPSEAESKKAVPVPFPPTPPEKIPGAQDRGPEKPPASKKSGAPKKVPGGTKKGVRLIVRCTVCGTRHDAAGKTPGDKIQCVCGKKIRITAPKKKAKKKPSKRTKSPEELLDKKALRSEDVDVLDE